MLQTIFKPHTDDAFSCPPMFLRLLRLSPFGLFGALSALYASSAFFDAVTAGASANGKQGGASLGKTTNSEVLQPMGLFRAVEAAARAAKQQAHQEGMPLPENTDSELQWYIASAATRSEVALPRQQLTDVVDHLLKTSNSMDQGVIGCRPSAEAERLLLALLAVQAGESLDEPTRRKLIEETKRNGLLQATSWLHELHGEYGPALDCRIPDHSRSGGGGSVFDYIIERLAKEKAPEGTDYSASLVEATMQRLPALVEIDAESCAEMICEHFASVANHQDVLERLKARGYPNIELKYLETLLIKRRRSHWKRSEEQREFFENHVVRYIELLCTIDPKAVLPFLQENEALPLKECLDLCKKYRITDGSVYLLERTGDFVEVLELMLNGYGKALEQLHVCLAKPKNEDRATINRAMKRLNERGVGATVSAGSLDCPSRPEAGCALPGGSRVERAEEPWWEGFLEAQRCVDIIEHAYELSSRNSNLMTKDQLEGLWFGVLGRTVRCQENVSNNQEASRKLHTFLSAALADLGLRAMTGVLAYLSLPRALTRICNEFSASTLGLWKEPLQRMLSGLGYQQGLLVSAKAVAARDVVRPFAAVKQRGSRGVRIDSTRADEAIASGGGLRARILWNGSGIDASEAEGCEDGRADRTPLPMR